jgi:sterol desaturase/sphingolipid hydroxylase (fatty acid hydroxylase superfamily)
MMTVDAFLRSVAVILAAMALLAVVETLLPLSRKHDWRRRHLIPNLKLVALTLGLNFALNAGAVLMTAWLASHGFALLSSAPLPPLVTLLTGFIVLDASTYACHRLMHILPPLWRAHRVHHSDPLVDVTTALRQHPIEGVARFIFIMAPAWLLGVPVEAVAIYRVVSTLVALTEHMNVKLWEPLDRALSLVVCTPNMHKVHHSRLVSESDTNYGNIFSLFDRVLGTFTPPSPARSVDYGLEGYDDTNSQQFGALLRLPFREPDSSSAPQSRPRQANPITA